MAQRWTKEEDADLIYAGVMGLAWSDIGLSRSDVSMSGRFAKIASDADKAERAANLDIIIYYKKLNEAALKVKGASIIIAEKTNDERIKSGYFAQVKDGGTLTADEFGLLVEGDILIPVNDGLLAGESQSYEVRI